MEVGIRNHFLKEVITELCPEGNVGILSRIQQGRESRVVWLSRQKEQYLPRFGDCSVRGRKRKSWGGGGAGKQCR